MNILQPNGNAIKLPKTYLWKPKEDITAYELALCMPLLINTPMYDPEIWLDELPECAKRHFEETSPHRHEG